VIDIVDFNAAPHGEREISDQALSGVIETLSDSTVPPWLRDVEAVFFGRAYEYLLPNSESQGQSAANFSRTRSRLDHRVYRSPSPG